MTSSAFIFAGEPSGDVAGAALIQAWLRHTPSIQISAVAGVHMRQCAISCLPLTTEDFSVMGFGAVFKALPRIAKQFREVRDHILQSKPEIVVLIDYPGFNLRLAKSLKKKGYSGHIVQYVCPTFWAWGKKRLESLKSHADLVLSIYPFEGPYLDEKAIPNAYIGNPVLAEIQNQSLFPSALQEWGIHPHKPLLSLFPGSRATEVQYCLPKMLQAAQNFQRQAPHCQIALSLSRPELLPLIKNCTQELTYPIIPPHCRHELMEASHCSLAASGTVTLELALHKTPTVVVYDVSWVNRFIAQYLIRLNLEFFSMANIIGGKQVFPEFIAHHFTSQKVERALEELWKEGKARRKCLQRCQEVYLKLGEEDASTNAIQAMETQLLNQSVAPL